MLNLGVSKYQRIAFSLDMNKRLQISKVRCSVHLLQIPNFSLSFLLWCTTISATTFCCSWYNLELPGLVRVIIYNTSPKMAICSKKMPVMNVFSWFIKDRLSRFTLLLYLFSVGHACIAFIALEANKDLKHRS